MISLFDFSSEGEKGALKPTKVVSEQKKLNSLVAVLLVKVLGVALAQIEVEASIS
jgi:hypothetical protein